MNEVLVLAGGVYTLLLVVFHLLFWRIFKWPDSLKPLDRVNRSTMQVLNLSITFIFLIFAYVSLMHVDELLGTALGKSLLALISMLWVFRAIQQLVFYGVRHKASVGLALYFVVGAILYGIPGFT